MLTRALATVLLVALLPQTPQGTLIVSNMNDNTATILDAATGRVWATVPTGAGPHEVAVSRDGRKAFVSNYGVRGQPGNTITVIDVERAAVERTITIAAHRRPHGMAVLPGDTLLAVTSEMNGAVLLLDVRTGTVARTIATKGRASHMVAVSANGAVAVTGNIADNNVSVLSLNSAADARLINVARQPEAVGLSPDGRTVWVGSNQDSLVLVLDIGSARTDTIRGFGLPYRIVISPDARVAVVSDPVRGNVRVFDAATRAQRFDIAVPRDSIVATAEVPGSPSPEGVAISRDNRYAFVTLQGRNRVITIDLTRGTIVRYAPTGVWSDGIAYSPIVARPR